MTTENSLKNNIKTKTKILNILSKYDKTEQFLILKELTEMLESEIILNI